MKMALLICCELDSTLRPTIERGFDIIPALLPELILYQIRGNPPGYLC